MADVMSPAQRSRLMSRIRGKDTAPERYLDVLLRAAGLRFAKHSRELPGRPDFVLRDQRVVVFVNGDFWHGWRFPVWGHKLSIRWRRKVADTRRRDRENARRLARIGWKVIKIWEHQVEQDLLACVKRIVAASGVRPIDWGAVEAARKSLPSLRRRDRLPKP
jgi:DNA mismatch endonuclease (patch repair protein)